VTPSAAGTSPDSPGKEFFFAQPKPRPKWVNLYHATPTGKEIGGETKFPLLEKDEYPSSTAQLAKRDKKAMQLLVAAGTLPVRPDFKVAFRTLRPDDVFVSLGEQIAYH
jgi:hypothetical protein